VAEPLLSIRDLCVDYITGEGAVRAIDHVSLDVAPGETVGIAGESGSGKSTLAQALLRILPPPAVITNGEVWFKGRDLLTLGESELRRLRWSEIAMVFQSAMDALNPVITVGEQIGDTLEAHGAGENSRERAAELMEMVGIPAGRLDAYAHQLSGGMRQRVGIALALALKPSLVILDEPTTALDVIVERDILAEIRGLQKSQGFAVMFITHDLGRMLQFSDRVAVFYAGKIAETGPASELRHAPQHPYTQGLIRAFPTVHGDTRDAASIPGAPPSLMNPPAGCRFHPRCPHVMDVCRTVDPKLLQIGPRHAAACHLLDPAVAKAAPTAT
jgi:peptide/nickel transport system ATP-binding protein